MITLSLFDGGSCGQVSLNNIGIKPTKYYASEVDKYAIKVTQHNWPETIQLGDVTRWREWGIDWASIDLLIGGSPCQGFSYAGKQLLFDDPRSALFFVYVDILNHIKKHNPGVKFLLENVQMKPIAENTISYYLGVDPVFINSKDYSAYERPRNYWVNWGVESDIKKKKVVGDIFDFQSTKNTMSETWHKWFNDNKKFQINKKYSRILNPESQGLTMTTRQYANWNGNFIPTPDGRLRKPNKKELALACGLPFGYFKCVTQRQSEVITGNGWQVDTIEYIFKQMNNPLRQQLRMEIKL